MKEVEKNKFKDILSNLIQKYRVLIVVVLSAGIIISGTLAVFVEMDKGTQIQVAADYVEINKNLQDWKVEADSVKKADLETQFQSSIDKLVALTSQGPEIQNLYLVWAQYYEEKGDLAQVIAKYESAIKAYPQGAFVPGILSLLAGSHEKNADFESALKLYDQILGIQSFEAQILQPMAYFNKARIQELTSKNAEALETYGQLLDTFPDNDLSKLARSRIIALNL